MLDPKWLDLLKANGLKVAAVAIGCAILLWASGAGVIPSLDAWVVQIIVAAMVICGLLAIASAISQSGYVYGKAAASVKRRRALAYAIDTLNPDEIDFLKGQIKKGESTVQLNPFDAGSIRYFVHRAGLFQGLQNKGIVSVSAADREGKIQTVTIEKVAWRILKKKFKNDVT
jgi:hypothetical protein